MINKYELTAKLAAPLLQAFREGYSVAIIEDSLTDAFVTAKAQYHKEVEAKRKAKNFNDKDKMKQLILAGMKAMRSFSDDKQTQAMTDEYLESMLTDDVLEFASELSKSITNVSNELFRMGANFIQEGKNDNTTTHISNSNTDNDPDSHIIGEWLKHQKW